MPIIGKNVYSLPLIIFSVTFMQYFLIQNQDDLRKERVSCWKKQLAWWQYTYQIWQHRGRSVLFYFRSHLSVWIIDTNFCLHSSSHCIYVLARSKSFNAIPAMPFSLQLKPSLSSHWSLLRSFVWGFVWIRFV